MDNTLINSSVNNTQKFALSLRDYIVEERSKRGHQDIWFNDISVLFDPAFLFEIIPTTNMTMGEKINAITRFAFFLSLLLTLFKQNYIYVYVFLVPVIVTYVVFIFSPNSKEFFKDSSDLKDNSINNSKNDDDLTKIMEDALGECQPPNHDNPLMNILPTDNFEKRKPACNVSDPNISMSITDKIDDTLAEKLYLDTTNIYNSRAGERAFYTMPISRIPNDQGSFAKWLYQTPVSCAIADTGTLKQVRACAFNNKSLKELSEDLRKMQEAPESEPSPEENA
jgi:hypothetical protein